MSITISDDSLPLYIRQLRAKADELRDLCSNFIDRIDADGVNIELDTYVSLTPSALAIDLAVFKLRKAEDR
mgnify:CR=1 FL=1